MGDSRPLATWLVRRRGAIEAALAARPGVGLPPPASAEAEALRRFRSFAAAALRGPEGAEPSLEGLGLVETRVGALVDAWIEAAAALAGPDGPAVRDALGPLGARFRDALRATPGARRARGAPRPGRRRVVSAAIDRVADAFLAVDTQLGTIEDANPAAGALLGTPRDALLGRDALGFVREDARPAFWSQLDAVAEGSEARRFHSVWVDPDGRAVPVEASVSRFATRRRTLALFLARVAP